jgi:putative ABC transport system permease protein
MSLGQLLTVSRLCLAGLTQRIGSSLVIVIGMACVAGVLITILSVTVGILRVARDSGDPGRALVFSARSVNEYAGDLGQATVDTILDAPGIARDDRDKPLADAELLLNAPPADGFAQGTLAIRGIGPEGLKVRPEFRLTGGRMFVPGHHELIVGESAHRTFHFNIGDRIIMPDGEWPIVGSFTGGGHLEGQLLGDVTTLMAAVRRTSVGSVLVRLTSPAGFDAFNQWLTHNPTLAVTAMRQGDYYESQGAQDTFYTTMAVLVGGAMSIGALFASMTVLYAAVRSRTREIATLRALGYLPGAVAASVFTEALLLAFIGGLAGSLIAWACFDGHDSVLFRWSIRPQLIVLGTAWTLALALVSALPPALYAVRLPLITALRE